MKQYASVILFCAVSLINSFCEARGWVSRGGGSGVACFQDIRDAVRARSQKGPLPQNLRQKIYSLQTTDLWEGEQENVPTPVKSNEVNSDIYLHRILDKYYGTLSPQLMRRVGSALKAMDFASAIPSIDGLERVFDLGKMNGLDFFCNDQRMDCPRELKSNCAFVQLAVRKSETNDDGSFTHKVQIDLDLFQKLGMQDGVVNNQSRIQNQAALRLHEVLYLIGFELGNIDSARVRKIVPILLSSLFAENLNKSNVGQQYPTRIMAYTLIHLFSIAGLAELPIIRSNSPTQEMLIQAYLGLEKKMENGMSKAMNQLSNHSNLDLSSVHNVGRDVVPKLNEAETFLAIIQYLFLSGDIDDFYEIINHPELNKLNEICRMVEQKSGYPNRSAVAEKGLCFCTEKFAYDTSKSPPACSHTQDLRK